MRVDIHLSVIIEACTMIRMYMGFALVGERQYQNGHVYCIYVFFFFFCFFLLFFFNCIMHSSLVWHKTEQLLQSMLCAFHHIDDVCCCHWIWLMIWKEMSFKEFQENDFSNSESLCHCDASHQVLAQSELRVGRCRLKNVNMAFIAAILDIGTQQF